MANERYSSQLLVAWVSYTRKAKLEFLPQCKSSSALDNSMRRSCQTGVSMMWDSNRDRCRFRKSTYSALLMGL
jgi:hypothetical protein